MKYILKENAYWAATPPALAKRSYKFNPGTEVEYVGLAGNGIDHYIKIINGDGFEYYVMNDELEFAE